MTEKAPNSNFTSNEETKNFVTPFAFGVDRSLIGQPLASPKRRLFAIFLDLIFIAMLTKLEGFWFSAIVLLVAVYGLIRMRADEGRKFAKVALGTIAVLSAIVISVACLRW